jgi:hypothetical protein
VKYFRTASQSVFPNIITYLQLESKIHLTHSSYLAHIPISLPRGSLAYSYTWLDRKKKENHLKARLSGIVKKEGAICNKPFFVEYFFTLLVRTSSRTTISCLVFHHIGDPLRQFQSTPVYTHSNGYQSLCSILRTTIRNYQDCYHPYLGNEVINGY